MLDLYLTFKILGILAVAIFGSVWLKSYGVSLVKSVFITVFSIISAYFGSTFWYIFQNENWRAAKTAADWAALMDSSGSVLYGWILAGSACAVILSKILKLNPLQSLDALLPWLLVAQILNRFGCFAGECCFGSPSNLPWAVYNSYIQARVHPVQLYEAVLDAVLLIILFRQPKVIIGRRTFLYFLGYPFCRFFLEFFRGDNKPVWLGMTVPQIASLVILIALGIWLLKRYHSPKKA